MNFAKIKNSFISFLNGYYFPVFSAALTIIGAFFGIEIFTISVLVLFVIAGVILCDDMKFMLSPVLFVTFSISTKTLQSRFFQSVGLIVWFIIAALALIGAIITHFVIYKKTFKCVIKGKLFIGFIALFCAYLLGGIFNFKEYYIGEFAHGGYSLSGFIFVIVMILMFSIPIFIFGAGIKPSTELKKYFTFILFLASLIITFEVFHLLIFGGVFENGSIIKERIVLGWSTWNGIGAMLTILIPSHFYFASTHKRGYIFFVTGLISYLAILFTLSRASLLVATLILGLCIIYGCFKGENKKMFRILTISALACAILVIIVFWSKLSNVLVDYLNRGFNDNGRFELYLWGFQTFQRHPLFGAGFANVYHFEPVNPDILAINTPILCHNTIIQMMAACGIVGLIIYLFHRYQTVRLFVSKRKNPFAVFMALSILALLLTSLLDVHFFIFYFILYYATILTIVEKDISTIENDESKEAFKETIQNK